MAYKHNIFSYRECIDFSFLVVVNCLPVAVWEYNRYLHFTLLNCFSFDLFSSPTRIKTLLSATVVTVRAKKDRQILLEKKELL